MTIAVRVLIKFRLKCRCVVAFLCLFILSVVMIYSLPNFPSEQSTVHLLGPLNNKPSRLVERHSLRPHLQMPSNRQSGTRKNTEVKDSTKHLLMINHHQLSFSSGKTAEGKVHVSSNKSPKNGANKKEVYLQNINKHLFQPFVATGNRGQAIKLGNSRNFNPTEALPQSDSMQSLHPNNKTCQHKCTPDGVKAKSLLGQFTQAQQVPKLKPSERKRSHSGAEIKGRILAGAGMSDFATDWCMTVPNEAFIEDWNQTKAESLPWLNEDDIKKMTLLSRDSVLSKARLPGHGQVLQVGFHDTNAFAEVNHIKRCQMGGCALIKHPNDWFEVFAFHLDRVLGLNRSLPAVLRKFHSDILPYKYTNGAPRPVVWWDPNIRHLSDPENDQNSFLLTWPQYQTLLQSRCGTQVPLNSTNCVGVHHSEWGRLALFDFLLQVNDRLDRYCCGFRPDPSELCVENMLHIKCGNPRDLNLVHILVRKTDPSRLVFIDNAGRPHQPQDNLNFRLVKGIDEFPEQAISVLQSGCLERRLLWSLSVDREFWVSRGGTSSLRSLIQHVEQRAKALLLHIQEKKLKLNTDI